MLQIWVVLSTITKIWLVLSSITFGAIDNASHDKLRYELLMLLFMPQ